MAQTQPPQIDPVPTPPIQRGDRATFSSRVDAFIIWLVNAVTQFRALATNVYNNAVDAFQSASLSASKATAATDSATAANTSAGSAANSASAAANSATNSASSAAESANSALALTSTSTTSNTLSTGNKTFQTQAGKQFTKNVPITIVDSINPENSLFGYVTNYSGNSLSVNITASTGSGSNAKWNISVSGIPGQRGVSGGLTGANLTGPLNFAKSSDVASASTTDIWNTTGNIVPVTGTSNITAFSAAPQAGATRKIIAKGSFTITSGANLVVKGGTFTANVNDEIDVVAETTTLFKVTRIPSAGLRPMTVVLTTGTTYTVPAQDFVVEAVAAGSGGNGYGASSGATGGRSGGYVKKVVNGATVGSIAVMSIGTPGAGGLAGGAGGVGGNTTFTLSGLATIVASSTGNSTGGDVVVNGMKGNRMGATFGSSVAAGSGASSALGIGGIGDYFSGVSGSGFGSGGAAGGLDSNSVWYPGGAGAPGVIIISYLG